jgi:hypothetical protein
MRPLLNALAACLSTAAFFIGIILSGCWVTSTRADNRIVSEVIVGWDFGVKEDLRRDGWPDGWSRTTGQNYPKFIPISISQKANAPEELAEIEQLKRLSSQFWLAFDQRRMPWQVIPESTPPAVEQFLERTILNPYLRVQMDGGAAEILSPLVPIDEQSVYYASASIRNNSADFAATVRLRFLDKNKAILFETAAKTVSGKNDWQTVSSNSTYAYLDKIGFAQVVLSVAPKTAKAYRGEIGFDNVRIHRTPRLTLSVDKPSKMYRQGEKVVVRCVATGMNTEQPSLTLVLVDHTGQEVLSANQPFVREDAPKGKLISKTVASGGSSRNEAKMAYWDGYCEWVIPNREEGYYEISTQLSRGKSGTFELLEHFAILQNDGLGRPDSRFGWTMTETNDANPTAVTTSRLIDVLRECRVGKVKLPVWFDNLNPISVREHTERVDRIQTTGVQCIGVLASPPQSIREKFPRLDSNETGAALEDSVLVQSFLEPVMRQMCVRILDFQIGWDHETDFVSNPRFGSSLDSIVRLAKRYGQETQIIASHNPQLPIPKIAAIDRWQLHSSQELTDREIAVTLDSDSNAVSSGHQPWFSITPLSASKYSLDVRIQDMAARMLVIAREIGSSSTTGWVSDPCSDQVGMLDRSGGPQEMFIPFRSITGALAGMRNAGSLPIPSLGFNRLLVSADQARLIAWSHQPATAQLFLGDKIQARDVWGRSVEVKTVDSARGREQLITIDKWPIIIDGIDLNVAQWRMGVNLLNRKIDPLQGLNQEIKIRFTNPLAVPAVGSLRVIAPSTLMDSPQVAIEVDANSTSEIIVPITIVPDASSNLTPIRLDFSMNGNSPVRFSIDEEVQIGSDDIEFNMTHQIDDQDQLWMTIEAINHREEPVSFDCMLLIPNRPRERIQIANLKERTTRTFVLKKASELIGETLWLRCEQFGTRRVLNQQQKIAPTTE